MDGLHLMRAVKCNEFKRRWGRKKHILAQPGRTKLQQGTKHQGDQQDPRVQERAFVSIKVAARGAPCCGICSTLKQAFCVLFFFNSYYCTYGTKRHLHAEYCSMQPRCARTNTLHALALPANGLGLHLDVVFGYKADISRRSASSDRHQPVGLRDP